MGFGDSTSQNPFAPVFSEITYGGVAPYPADFGMDATQTDIKSYPTNPIIDYFAQHFGVRAILTPAFPQAQWVPIPQTPMSQGVQIQPVLNNGPYNPAQSASLAKGDITPF